LLLEINRHNTTSNTSLLLVAVAVVVALAVVAVEEEAVLGVIALQLLDSLLVVALPQKL
jgi:hypothetical protein